MAHRAYTGHMRFWSKVDIAGPEDCWPWAACRNRLGYGQFGVSGRVQGAHRVAWALTHGPIVGELCVLHHCDNPPCVNPAHLYLGTPADNNRDTLARGRHVSTQGLKTHCRHGHPFDAENTYRTPDGRRGCRACRRDQLRAHRERARGDS